MLAVCCASCGNSYQADTARREVIEMSAGHFAAIRATFDSSLLASFSVSDLRQAWGRLCPLGHYGGIESISRGTSFPPGRLYPDVETVGVRCSNPYGGVLSQTSSHVLFAFNAKSQVAGLAFLS